MPHHTLLLSLAAAAATLAGGVFATSEAQKTPLRLADAEPASAAGALSCEIRETDAGSARTLEAVVRGPRALSGDYRFAVTSRSAGGASRSAQNGTFELERHTETVLGEIGLSARSSYAAKLTLTLPDDEVVCEAEG